MKNHLAKFKLIFIIGMIWMLLLPTIYASGFAKQYLPGNTLKMHKGETELFWINLQNGENKTLEMTISLTSGRNISTIVNATTHTMPPYTYDKFVYFNITLPKDAKGGERWKITFELVMRSPPTGGMISFDTAVIGHFWVEAIKEPKKSKWPYFVAIIIVIILGLGYIGFRRYKKDGKKPQDPLEEFQS